MLTEEKRFELEQKELREREREHFKATEGDKPPQHPRRKKLTLRHPTSRGNHRNNRKRDATADKQGRDKVRQPKPIGNDVRLQQAVDAGEVVTVLMSGHLLECRITSVDKYTLLVVEVDGPGEAMLYKHAISSITFKGAEETR